MEYIVDVLMKLETSLQLKTRTTPGNQGSFATKPKSVPKQRAAEEQPEYLDALHALIQDDIVEAVDSWMPELDSIENTPRHCVGDRPRSSQHIDTCFTHVKHICQYIHHTLGYALRYVPIPRETKHKLWVLGGACLARNEEKSQQGLIVYHGITSENKNGGNLVQWRSSRQDLIAKSTCEAELIASSEAFQQGENIAIVVAEMTNGPMPH